MTTGLCWGGPLEGQLIAGDSNRLVCLKDPPPRSIGPREMLPSFEVPLEYEYYRAERFTTRLPGPKRPGKYGHLDPVWFNQAIRWRDTDMTKFHWYRSETSWEEVYYMTCYAWVYEPEADQQKRRIEAGARLVQWLCGALAR